MSLTVTPVLLEPYRPAADGRQGWKRGLCGRAYCRETARWTFVDRAGHRRSLCAGHAARRGAR